MAGTTAHGTSGPRHSVHPRPRIGCGPTPRPFARSCRTLCAPRGPHAHHMVSMCHARGWRPHGVQHATPWAQIAHAYSSASRHTRRCSSRPPQGAGWSHSAEEAFMATQGPLGFFNTSNVLRGPLAEKVQLSSTERTAESTPRPGAAEMPEARCYTWFWRRFDEKQRANC